MLLHARAAPSRLGTTRIASNKPAFTAAAAPARLRHTRRAAADADEELDDNPFFNDAFKTVLAEALSRQEERKGQAPDFGPSSNGNGYGNDIGTASYEYGPASSSYTSSSDNHSSNGSSNAYYSNGSSHGSSNGYSSTTHIPDSFATSSFSSYASAEEETAPSLQEEVLITALGSSKMTLKQLRQIQTALERAIEREEKQVERLEFALQKARTDAAYYASLDQINRSRRRSWRDL